MQNRLIAALILAGRAALAVSGPASAAAGNGANPSAGPLAPGFAAARPSVPEPDLRSLDTDALFDRAARLLKRGGRQDSTVPLKCGFGLLQAVRSRLPQFSPAQRAMLKPLFERPDLPESFVTADLRFKIHYTNSGIDAVPQADHDRNGIPDYVDSTAEALARVYRIEIQTLGFRAPPIDRVDGSEWDIYLIDIPDSYGFATTDSLVGNSPYTWTSYIKIDNDYLAEEKYASPGLDGMRVTLAHEFLHMVQFGEGAEDIDSAGFLMEAAATWMEDQVYDGINDYYNYLTDFFGVNNRRLDTFNGSREYGLCVWFHFLEKVTGTAQVVRDVFDLLVSSDVFTANDLALRLHGTTFADALGLFYAWNLRTGSRADAVHYYPEGSHYPELVIDRVLSLDLDNSVSASMVPTGAMSFEFDDPSGGKYLVSAANVQHADTTESSMVLSIEPDAGGSSATKLDDRYAASWVSENRPPSDWRLYAFAEKSGQFSGPVGLVASAQMNAAAGLPDALPNPFLPSRQAYVRLPFRLETPGLAHLLVATAAGSRVYEEAKEFPQGVETGVKYFWWYGKNSGSESVAAGIYVYVIEKDGFLLRTGRIAVIR
jgi:hypothetical protein